SAITATCSCLLPTAWCLVLFRLSQNHLETPSTILRCPSGGGHSVNIFDARIGASFEQHPDRGILSIRRPPHQRRPTKFVLHIWIRAGIKQQTENRSITKPCCTVQRCIAFFGLMIGVG